MKLVVATNNKDKLAEIQTVLAGKFDELLTMKDVGLDIDIEETGSTFLENAMIKAKTVCDLVHLPTLADDSGLEVDALGGAPGIYSARYAGEECNYEANIQKLLCALDGVSNRRAAFTSTVAVCYPDGTSVHTSGKTTGVILDKKCGTNGFGYDPIFFSDDLQCTFAEAAPEQKNAVSHRGRALRNILDVLK